MTIDHTCSHLVKDSILFLLCPMLGTEQYHSKTWNIVIVEDLYLVDSAIIIFNVHDEDVPTIYHQSSANASIFYNLYELEIIEMVLVGWYCGQTVVVHTNHERGRNQSGFNANCSWLYRLYMIDCLGIHVRWTFCIVNGHANCILKRTHDLE